MVTELSLLTECGIFCIAPSCFVQIHTIHFITLRVRIVFHMELFNQVVVVLFCSLVIFCDEEHRS